MGKFAVAYYCVYLSANADTAKPWSIVHFDTLMRLLSIFCLLISFSCNQKSAKPDKEAIHALTNWIVANEDSLYFQFNSTVKKNTSKDVAANAILLEREYEFEDGHMNELTNRIHQFDSDIHVIYLYKPKAKPSFQILLTPDFDKKCVPAVDAIFSDLDSLYYFRIVKYRPPGDAFSAFIVNDEIEHWSDTLKPEELRFKLSPVKNQYDLTVYIPKNLMEETKQQLLLNIFGERIPLKRFRNVHYLVTRDTVENSMGIDEVRTFFLL